MYSKKITFFILLLCLCSAWTVAFAEAAEVAVLETHRFGKVEEGDVVSHTFSFKNDAEYQIVVYQIVSSCGCVTVDHRGKTLEPGEALEIPVKFHTRGFSEKVRKEIEVMTSHQQTPRVRFALDGVVLPALETSPEKLLFTSLTTDKESEELQFIVHKRKKINLRVKSLHPQVNIRKLKVENNKTLYSVRLSPPLEPGEFSSLISIQDRTGKVGTLLPIRGEVKGSLTLEQPAMAFGVVDTDQIYKKQVGLSFEGKADDVSVEADSDAIAVVYNPETGSLDVELNITKDMADSLTETRIDGPIARLKSEVVIKNLDSGERIILLVTALVDLDQPKNSAA